MFQTTTADSFQSWEKFVGAYYEPIRAALRLMPFVGADRADDVAHEFFLKLYERDLLTHRPTIKGRFRDWLYTVARNHALDEWRKAHRRPACSLDAGATADPHSEEPGDLPFDVDECYALSILHLTVGRVRKHLLQVGKAEHWMVFEELALAPLIPGRAARSREELLAMFPGHGPAFLDNRMTTVKRVFRRMLPALIPVDRSEGRTAEQRLEEFLGILSTSAKTRLWLAFLADPCADPRSSEGSSLDLAVRPIGGEGLDPGVSADILHDELRVLLSFWMEMPLQELPDDWDGAEADAATPGRRPGSEDRNNLGQSVAASLKLRDFLVETEDSGVAATPVDEMTALLRRLKTFAKRVHRPRADSRSRRDAAPAVCRFEDTMPFEVAQVLYNLAGALALTRCDSRIVGLSNDQFRRNITWALNQSWLDARLRPVFFAALARLDALSRAP